MSQRCDTYCFAELIFAVGLRWILAGLVCVSVWTAFEMSAVYVAHCITFAGHPQLKKKLNHLKTAADNADEPYATEPSSKAKEAFKD